MRLPSGIGTGACLGFIDRTREAALGLGSAFNSESVVEDDEDDAVVAIGMAEGRGRRLVDATGVFSRRKASNGAFNFSPSFISIPCGPEGPAGTGVAGRGVNGDIVVAVDRSVSLRGVAGRVSSLGGCSSTGDVGNDGNGEEAGGGISLEGATLDCDELNISMSVSAGGNWTLLELAFGVAMITSSGGCGS